MVRRGGELQRPRRNGCEADGTSVCTGAPGGPGRPGRLRHHERDEPMRRVLRDRDRRRGHQDRSRNCRWNRTRINGRQEAHAPQRCEGRRRGRCDRPPGRSGGGIPVAGARTRCRGCASVTLRAHTKGRRGGGHGRDRCRLIVHGPLRRSGNGPEHHLLRIRGGDGGRAVLHTPRTLRGRDGGGLRQGRRGPPPRMGRGVRAALHRRPGQAGQALRRRGRVLDHRHR